MKDENLTQQQQDTTAPEAERPIPSVSVPPAEAVAVPAAPAEPAPGAVPSKEVEELKQAIAKYRRDIDALKSVKDREIYERDLRYQQQLADLQAQLYQAQTADMSDEERQQLELRQTQQQYALLEEQLQMQGQVEAARQYKEQLTAYYLSEGVPAAVLNSQEAQASPQGMQKMAIDYFKRGSTRSSQLPARPVSVQPQQPTATPPPMTTHAEAAQPSNRDEQLAELQRKTEKDHQDTLTEAYKILFGE